MFFLKKKTVEKIGFLRNVVDCHCHILPGVDDGVKSMEDALDILKVYEDYGVSIVWFTPHIMEETPNETSALQKRFEELKKAYAELPVRPNVQKVKLNLAAEYMMDSLFEERLQNKDLLTYIGDDKLLVETSYFNPPSDMMGILQRIKSKGFYPVLAHPERYMYMSTKDYEKLRRMDVEFQLNLGSLSNCYGKRVKKNAKYILDKRWYNYIGTDLHSVSMLERILNADATNLNKLNN